MDFTSIALVAVPVALSALAFVAYNHPSSYVYLQLFLTALILLTMAATGGYSFGAMYMKRDIHLAMSDLPSDCKLLAWKAVDNVQLPPLNTIMGCLFLFTFVIAFLGYLPKLGITKDQK